MDINYRNEQSTHINISKNSSSQLGKDLWDFLTNKFKVKEDGDYTTLLELTGSLYHNKGRKILPTVIENGNIINNSSVIKTLMHDRLKEDHDLLETLLENDLPLAMYDTVKYKGARGPKVDIDDSWIADTIMEIVQELKLRQDVFTTKSRMSLAQALMQRTVDPEDPPF